jgi:hypothetical protein
MQDFGCADRTDTSDDDSMICDFLLTSLQPKAHLSFWDGPLEYIGHIQFDSQSSLLSVSYIPAPLSAFHYLNRSSHTVAIDPNAVLEVRNTQELNIVVFVPG